jgi:hypothetical protein
MQYPDRLQTPLLPVKPPPERLSPPVSISLSLPLSLLSLSLSLSPHEFCSFSLQLGIDHKVSPEQEKRDTSVYANVKVHKDPTY